MAGSIIIIIIITEPEVSNCLVPVIIGDWPIANKFVGPSEMTLRLAKCGNLRSVITYNVITDQTEYWIFSVVPGMRTCNFCSSVLSRICRNIERHFKRSIETLIVTRSDMVLDPCTMNFIEISKAILHIKPKNKYQSLNVFVICIPW